MHMLDEWTQSQEAGVKKVGSMLQEQVEDEGLQDKQPKDILVKLVDEGRLVEPDVGMPEGKDVMKDVGVTKGKDAIEDAWGDKGQGRDKGHRCGDDVEEKGNLDMIVLKDGVTG